MRKWTHLHHRVALDVVLEPLELQVENRRERLEDDTLLGVLQAQTFSLVLVLPVERLDRDVVSE